MSIFKDRVALPYFMKQLDLLDYVNMVSRTFILSGFKLCASVQVLFGSTCHFPYSFLRRISQIILCN